MVLLNQVFPCFHCFSKATPSHIYKLCNIFLFRGRGECNVTKLSHRSIVYFKMFIFLKHTNLEKMVFSYQKLVCKEFLMNRIYW